MNTTKEEPGDHIDILAVCKRAGISRSQGYILRKSDPSFPRGKRISKKIVRYEFDEVIQWLATRERV